MPQSSQRSVERSFLWLLLAALAGFTAACGSDHDTTGPETSPTTIPEGIAPIDPSKVEAVGDVWVVTNHVTVITEVGMPVSDLLDAVEALGGSVVASLPGLEGTDRRIYQVELETSSAQRVSEVANELWGLSGVVTAMERTLVATETHFDNEARGADTAWAYETVRASDAWHIINRSSRDLQPVKVGLIDTGVDSNHPEFDGRRTWGEGFVWGQVGRWEDQDGHGTKVAGAMIANVDGEGMNGVLGARKLNSIELYVYRVGNILNPRYDPTRAEACQNRQRMFDSDAIYAALYNAAIVDQLDLVNMSFAQTFPSSADSAADRIVSLATDVLSRNPELVLVAAAGNSGVSVERTWPIRHKRFLTVGGTDKDDDRWVLGRDAFDCPIESAVGPISIAAPATEVWTTELGGDYAFGAGTSLAAPLVTGAVGTLLALGTPAGDVRDVLQSTAADIDTDQGQWKRLELCRAVADVLGLSTSKRIIAESGQGNNQPPSDLYSVEPFECGEDDEIATIHTPSGETPFIADLAFDAEGTLWGTSFEVLYRIDLSTGTADSVGSFDVLGVNAMDFSSEGTLYGATRRSSLFVSEPGELVRIDTTTAATTMIGEFDTDLQSSGDLAFAEDGTLFAAVRKVTSGENALATIDTVTGEAELVDPDATLGFVEVFGLHFVDGALFGLTAEGGDETGNLIVIDTARGTAQRVRPLTFSAFGAASRFPDRTSQ